MEAASGETASCNSSQKQKDTVNQEETEQNDHLHEQCESKTESEDGAKCKETIEILSEDIKQERIEDALELKQKGNLLFTDEEFEKAVSIYTEALEVCPKSESKHVAVLFSNRAACYVRMKDYPQAIKDCTSALEIDRCYIKARLRRAQTYECEEKLEDALEDYKKILELDRSCTPAGEAAMRLPDQIKERNEKLKDEMMGKLKDLGNMVLKPFGFSTDNFKMQQDPNTGGYSINFQK